MESFGYGLSRAASQSVNIVLVPLYTHLFSPNEYGVVDVMRTIAALLTAVLVLGTDTALSLHYYDDENVARRQGLATAAWCIRLLAAFLVLGLLAIRANSISLLLFGNATYAPYLLLTILLLPFSLSLQLFVHLLRLRFALLKYNAVSVGLLLLTVGMNLYLVLYKGVGIVGIFWADLVAGILAALAGFVLTRKDFGLSWSPAHMRTLLAVGLPMAPASLGAVAIGMADRFFLLRYSTLDVVGLYAVGVKLSNLIALVTGAFQTAWLPFALSIAKESDAKNVYAKVLRYYLLLTMAIAVLLSNFSKEILYFFTTPAYVQAYQVVGLLACNAVVTQAYSIVSIGLCVTKNTRLMALTFGAGVVTTVLLDFILVPRLGMIGAALAPLLANLISAFLAYRMAQRSYPIPFEWTKIGAISVISLLSMLLGIYVSNGTTLFGVIAKASATFVLFPGALFLSGCIDRTEIRTVGRIAGRARAKVLHRC